MGVSGQLYDLPVDLLEVSGHLYASQVDLLEVSGHLYSFMSVDPCM